MSDFLDRLPSQEREKIRKRLRSPEAYEALREKVKGPEDLEKELEKSERMAELHFQLESEPAMREQLKSAIENDLREQGIEALIETDMSEEAKAALEEGRFTVAVLPHPESHEDVLTVLTEGTVQEKLPLTQKASESYSGGMRQSA